MVKRIKGSFERPIIVGSISNWLGKKADGYTHTHRWTAYIRGMNNEELPFIKKVVFHLHSSFKNPHRAVETPPYEISETGWGEFDLGVSIHYTDANEKTTELFHLLRLHPPDGIKTKQPVVSETLDVLTFHDPLDSFYNLIKMPEKSEINNPASQFTNATLTPAEEREINNIVDGRKRVLADVQKYRDLCKQKESEANTLYQSIQQLEKQKLIYQKKLEKYNQIKAAEAVANTTLTSSISTATTIPISTNNTTPTSSVLSPPNPTSTNITTETIQQPVAVTIATPTPTVTTTTTTTTTLSPNNNNNNSSPTSTATTETPTTNTTTSVPMDL